MSTSGSGGLYKSFRSDQKCRPKLSATGQFNDMTTLILAYGSQYLEVVHSTLEPGFLASKVMGSAVSCLSQC